MSGAGATHSRRAATARPAQPRVGVIDNSGHAGAPIADILTRDGFSVVAFDAIDTLMDIDPADAPAAFVLWVDAPVSTIATLIEPLTKRFVSSPVVLTCPPIQRWEVRAALARGVSGVVTGDELDSALGPCVTAALVGQVCVPRAHWRQIAPPVLSTREKQILGLVVMGYMNSQIAAQLFLAESTVKSHLSSAFGKLGVRSRNEAVDLILNPERGLGMGILALGGDPLGEEPLDKEPLSVVSTAR